MKKHRRGSALPARLEGLADVVAQLVTCSCGYQFKPEELRRGEAACPRCGNVSMWGGDVLSLQGILQKAQQGRNVAHPGESKKS